MQTVGVILFLIITWILFFYLGHVIGKASELVEEQKLMDIIKELQKRLDKDD